MSKLAELRKLKGLSQRELGVKSEVSIRMIQNYEQGAKDINRAELKTAVNLARVLGCHAEDLLEEEMTDS
jgi:transcriptional regulator with XRE-family HTH domain